MRNLRMTQNYQGNTAQMVHKNLNGQFVTFRNGTDNCNQNAFVHSEEVHPLLILYIFRLK